MTEARTAIVSGRLTKGAQSFGITDVGTVRATLAARLLGTTSGCLRIGDVTLRTHQRIAVARLAATLTAYGGALLADAPGLGKTYVALALAAKRRSVLVVAPAALREMWSEAARRTGADIRFCSMEGLSRGPRPDQEPDFVIVDEAHHARNPATARWRALSAICVRSQTLLLTATPVHNRPADVAALLALFLGRRAFELDAEALAWYTVRRDADGVGGAAHDRPLVHAPRRVPIAQEDELLDLLLALPAPVPPADGGDGGALLLFTLVRQWASSRGALTAALRRRLAIAGSLADALAAGRHPTTSELRAWSAGDDAVQLAFPELVASRSSHSPMLLEAVRRHEAAVRELLGRLRRSVDPDDERASRLEEIRAAHPGVRVVAFTQYADTVATLWRRLRTRPAVAALTARGAEVAGGRLTRSEALSRFAPEAMGHAEPSPADRIDLLITTDLISEGVNLQDAGVVVHLDLPWTPPRLEQRVGRAARLGSRHAAVSVYAFSPPASAERLLALERRLRDKLAIAGRTIGVSGSIIPPLSLDAAWVAPADASPVAAREAIRALTTSWLEHADPAAFIGETAIVSAVRATESGWIALLSRGDGDPLLAAAISSAPPSADARVVLQAMRLAAGEAAPVSEPALGAALSALEQWRMRVAAAEAVDAPVSIADRARRKALARLAGASGPRHLRARLAGLSALARRALTRPVSAGAERVLAELADAPLPIEAWLRAVAAFGDLHARDHGPAVRDVRLEVLLLLVAES